MATTDPTKVDPTNTGKETTVDNGKTDKELGLGAGPQVPDVARGNGEDLLSLQDLDPALNQKMHLVNNVRRNPRSTCGAMS